MPNLWIFISALVVVYLLPGADMILLLQTGATEGRAHAIATALGLAAARVIHVALAAFGLATLLRASPVAFDVMRYAGMAYLVWMGIGILRSWRHAPQTLEAQVSGHLSGYSRSTKRGFVTNVANPKALLFCSVLLPQFVAPASSTAGQFLLLGAILVAVGAAFDTLYSLAGASIGQWLGRHPFAYAVQQWTFATLLIGFGVRLAFTQMPA